MTLTIKELQDDATFTTRMNGRTWQSEATKTYDVISETPPTASDIDVVMGQWPRQIGVAHPVFSSLFLIEISARMNDHRVRVTETYGVSDQTATENQYGEIWEWDLAAQTTHIAAVTDPAKQVHYPTAYNTGAAIGVDGDSVNGVDVYRPSMSLKVSKHFTEGNLYAELQVIQNLLNKVNSGGWKYYAAGEVLFIGAPARKIKADDWLVEYNFLIARQAAAEVVTLADGVTTVTITRRPWDYVWYRYLSNTVDSGGGNLILSRGIESVHIAQVYEEGEFGNLNLMGPV